MRKLVVDDSSNVRSITFDVDERGGHLVVEFVDSRYRYDACAVEDLAAAACAPSVGKWVRSALVATRRPFTRLPPATVDAPRVDPLLTTLQTIASAGVGVASAAARDVLAGRDAPPPPPDCPRVVVVADGVSWAGSSSWLDRQLEILTPDEADAVGHALRVAALQARTRA